MPADLPEIRALLASLVGFTEGPWRIARTASRGGIDSCKVYTDALGEHPVCVGEVNGFRYLLADQRLFASAPDLHRHASELADEVERLRAHNARMATQINALADACDAAQKADREEEDAAEPLFEAMVGPKGGDWPEVRDALRRLAAGEVPDAR